jgi:uncharacterized protein YycO
MKPSEPCILLFRGRGFISAAIRWQTRSEYSHAAFLLPCGRVLESWQGAGVRLKWMRDWEGVESFGVHGMTPEQWATAITFARAQIGKKYDYRGVCRFVSRRKVPADDRWFCSELVAHSLQVAGVKLFRNLDSTEVSPGMIARSPMTYDLD